MDVSFALITEGITDQVALEAILKGHYKRFGDVDVVVNIVQPLRDATDASQQASDSDGGWERVFEACANPEVALGALSFNDYLIVQVDTDQGEHVNFGLPLAPGGVDTGEATLVDQARAIVGDRLGPVWADVSGQVFTAISVHSLECWMMALHAPAGSGGTKRCEDRLQREMERQNKTYSKDHDCYTALSKDFRKTRLLDAARLKSVSLNLFVESLPPVNG
jgi:hypothetical protein